MKLTAIFVTTLFALAGRVANAGYITESLGFIAPTIDGSVYDTNPAEGEIINDSSIHAFKGYTNGAWVSLSGSATVPVVHTYTTVGTSSYTAPTNPSPLYIKVTVVGGGGGGQGRAGNGGGGGTSSFGASLLTATGGSGCTGSTPTAGGGATVNSPAVTISALTGGDGSAGTQLTNANGSDGGTNPRGGAGVGGLASGGSGSAGIANTGAGDGGAAGNASVAYGSGGAGGYIQAIIPNPSGTYNYTVGASGNAGTTGGGAGGTGVVIVEEYYQ